MEVWRTSVEVTLYVMVPQEFLQDHLAPQLNVEGQHNIDTTVGLIQDALDELPQSSWSDTMADILNNAANLGIQGVVLYSE